MSRSPDGKPRPGDPGAPLIRLPLRNTRGGKTPSQVPGHYDVHSTKPSVPNVNDPGQTQPTPIPPNTQR